MSLGFPSVTLGVKNISSDLPEVGWYNLVCLEWLYMIKQIVLGFCSVGS